MAYNKTSEERKWNYWKEQEEKKLRELGMEEEKIQKLRQMDREDFLEERRYREHLDEMMQDMDSIKEKDSRVSCPLVNLNFQYAVVLLRPQSAHCLQSGSRTIFQFPNRRFC